MKRKSYSTTELAAALGVSRQRVHQMCRAGRVKGARQAWEGGPWLIPPNPVITRLKPGPKKK
jgi:hypothetical protein